MHKTIHAQHRHDLTLPILFTPTGMNMTMGLPKFANRVPWLET